MSQSSGTGSPVWFRCWADRQTVRGGGLDHTITLTGRERPYHAKRYTALGDRSTYITREYKCSCGHVGWSNHVDLAKLAGDDRQRRL